MTTPQPDQTDWARTWTLGAGDDMRTPSQWMVEALRLRAGLEHLRYLVGSQDGAGTIVRLAQLQIDSLRKPAPVARTDASTAQSEGEQLT